MLCCNSYVLNLGFTRPGMVAQEVKDEVLSTGVVVHEVKDVLLREDTNEEASSCRLSLFQRAEILQRDSVLDEVDKDAKYESQTVFKKGVDVSFDMNADGSRKDAVVVEGKNAVKRKKKRNVVSRRPNENTVGGYKSKYPKLEVCPS